MESPCGETRERKRAAAGDGAKTDKKTKRRKEEVIVPAMGTMSYQ